MFFVFFDCVNIEFKFDFGRFGKEGLGASGPLSSICFTTNVICS